MHLERPFFALLMVMLVACGGPRPAPDPGLHDTPVAAPPAPATAPAAAPLTPHPTTEASPPLVAPPAPRAGSPSLRDRPVLTAPGELPSLLVDEPLADTRTESSRLPLRSTKATLRLTVSIAEVEVVQRFENPRKTPIEVLYVFPLPENAAVTGLVMKTGGRDIEAKIDERTRARATYRAAKKEGLLAALLEQERSNVFVQSLANVAPGEAVEITTRYAQDLTYDAGVYEVVFPMVVGPRVTTGTSRITPPYLGTGQRSGADISVEVIADNTLAPKGFVSVTHEVTSRESPAGTTHVGLAKKDKLANRDFVLRFEAAADRPRAALATSGDDAGFFTLAIEPPALDVEGSVGKREVLFVVDVSGSTAGPPLALSKRALRLALQKLRPVDTFDVLTFSQGTGRLFDAPRPADRAAIDEALAFVDRMQAGGGTFVVDAIGAALAPNGDPERHRYVFFLTDGFVSADDLILRETRKMMAAFERAGRKAKVFGVGIGAAPNRAMLESLAREGNGAAVYAVSREDPAGAVDKLFRYIDHPVLRDVTIDWGTMKVSDVQPSQMPELLASRPLLVHGRFTGRPTRAPVVRASSAAGPIEIPVTAIAGGTERKAVGALWARSKIGELDADFAAGDAAARLEITRLGLEFGLVTRFTSFVAFDRGTRTSGDPSLLLQPAEAPEGVVADDQAQAPRRVEAAPGLAEATGREMSAPADAPATEIRGARGCFCHTPGSSAGGDGRVLALFLAVALAALRRTGSQRRGRRTAASGAAGTSAGSARCRGKTSSPWRSRRPSRSRTSCTTRHDLVRRPRRRA